MNPLWRVAQVTSVLVAVGVVTLLAFRPSLGLFLTWDVLVPVVPLTLLVAPQLWRNLCPIAAVSRVPAGLRREGRRRLGRRANDYAPLIAAVLLFAIVPLRLTIFNDNGPALAVFVLAVLTVALAGAFLYRGKSAWCATFCPVLPVERLYGHRPLLEPPHAWCADCSACVRACYDLDARRSLDQLTGNRSRRGANGNGDTHATSDGLAPLHRTWMGLFSAAFPGFVFGYFTAPNHGVVANYVWILGTAALSLLLLVAAAAAAEVPTRWMLRISAAGAAAIYYWFTVPTVALDAHELLALPPAAPAGIALARAVFLTVAAYWLLRADRSGLTARRRRPAPARA